MKPQSIEDKLALNKYDVDKDVHIRVREEICELCEKHPCLYACPADCFKLKEEHITFSYEGCLECGSCKIICGDEAIEWILPRAGFGICYQYG
jgi:ferredoxin like protein